MCPNSQETVWIKAHLLKKSLMENFIFLCSGDVNYFDKLLTKKLLNKLALTKKLVEVWLPTHSGGIRGNLILFTKHWIKNEVFH